MAETNNVLIVGVGSIGERHLRCFQATGRADLSLCEIDDQLRERISARYGISERTTIWKLRLQIRTMRP